jgi:hypothetical protein
VRLFTIWVFECVKCFGVSVFFVIALELKVVPVVPCIPIYVVVAGIGFGFTFGTCITSFVPVPFVTKAGSSV